MITSDRQYQAALAAIVRFQAAADHVDAVTADLDPLAREMMAEAYLDQLALLRAEVAEYEAELARSNVETHPAPARPVSG